jgi:hypothetical protein
VESDYRSGFEAALLPRMRGRSYDDAVNFLAMNYTEICLEDSFRRGYARGQAYYQRLIRTLSSCGFVVRPLGGSLVASVPANTNFRLKAELQTRG